MIRYGHQRVGVFIDVQNRYYSARHLFQRKVNFANIVEEAMAERQLIRAIAYVVTTKTGEEAPFLEALRKQGIETQEKELLEYTSGQKKADWDVGITVDIIKMLDLLDVVVLVSGDGDYIPLVRYCQSRGRQVEVISFRESTSTKLVEAVDGYTDLSADQKKFLIGQAQPEAPSHSAPRPASPRSAPPRGRKPMLTTKVEKEEIPMSGGGLFEDSGEDTNASEDDREERRGRTLSF